MMLSLLLLGDSQYPKYYSVFVQSPDSAVADLPSIAELRTQWTATNEKLSAHFASLTPDEWFTRHASVNAEDFAKEPHRNRLNVLLSRTNHLSYHRGQLVLLAAKD
jgi:hypothetical protein